MSFGFLGIQFGFALQNAYVILYKVYSKPVSFVSALNGIHTYTHFAKTVLNGTEYANATMKTIQLKIIKTAAWVKEMKTKIKIELPQFCMTKDEQIKGYERLMALRTQEC